MHVNARAVTGAYAAFARGDIDAVAATMSDDIVWHQAGAGNFAGDFTGKAAVLAHFADLMALTQGTYQHDVHAVLADDDHAAVLAYHTWNHPTPLEGTAVYVWHMHDGIGTECWAIPYDQATQDQSLAAAPTLASEPT